MENTKVNSFNVKHIIIKHLNFLIKDEKEAIDGYNKVLKYSINTRLQMTTRKLTEIRNEEIKHLNELEELKSHFEQW